MADLAGAFNIDPVVIAGGLTVNGNLIVHGTNSFRGNISGLTISNNAGDAVNDIDTAAGSARDSTDTDTMVLATAMGKQLDVAWAAGGTPGATVGGRMSAAAIANTTYHKHVIKNVTTGAVDVGFDVSATAPSLPAGYTLFRRIGSVLREAAALVAFRQYNDIFKRNGAAAVDRNSTVAAAQILLALSVPLGIRVMPLMSARLQGVGGDVGVCRIGDGDGTVAQIDVADINSSAADGLVEARSYCSGVMTNTAAQIRYDLTNSVGTPSTNTLVTMGWIDTRGRFD